MQQFTTWTVTGPRGKQYDRWRAMKNACEQARCFFRQGFYAHNGVNSSYDPGVLVLRFYQCSPGETRAAVILQYSQQMHGKPLTTLTLEIDHDYVEQITTLPPFAEFCRLVAAVSDPGK